ncbi:fructosamine kinase [Microdochium trichocladiopsis]|uniref:protein-ribulosamine 3-kinase n=1 Tax=Microdochium trichocladiopsis TaxID=1682393 RepID=A0A9P8YH68_9PEZI|nr:fructosamine kinase [Microdochium trichocladiopsis]KAH7040446.1 fructosamine kinase [Microdochium trichocladiopsis]
MSSVDPAILDALGRKSEQTKISSHGGSGFASTFRLSSVKSDGQTVNYFVKTGSGPEADVMFTGEHASLNAIHSAVPNLCPKSYAHGVFSSDANKFFLVTDFIDLHSKSHPGGSGESLARKLARLHTTTAGGPTAAKDEEEEGRRQFGFPVTTCCGSTPQDNSWKASWPEFYADNRLRAVLRAGLKNHHHDAELSDAVEATAARVVPRLLGAVDAIEPIRPVVVHGDLWSGNHGRGRIGGEGGTEEVVFDASAVYGHSEYELGIMAMFGGFSSAFWDEYLRYVPKAEPVAEWEDRRSLYELYHHLNHWAMFGGSYRSGAMSIMKRLISKYGS